jgi:hypothetical protein
MKYLFGGLLLVWLASIAYAGQKLYIGPEDGTVQKWAEKADFDGSILFCRGHYLSNRVEANGSGWFTDYPGADQNFLVRLAELTEVRVRFSPGRIPFFVVVNLYDPLIFKCPVLFMEDVGTIAFDEGQIKNLKRYFKQGGFLWVDDFWGDAAWTQWDYEIRRVLPRDEYPMIELPPDHPIFHQLYDVDGIWQMPNIGLWAGEQTCDNEGDCVPNPWRTSERGQETETPHMAGILDSEGRVIVVSTFNTDIADGWEEEKPENQAFINEFSARSYALGVNIFLYALTH